MSGRNPLNLGAPIGMGEGNVNRQEGGESIGGNTGIVGEPAGNAPSHGKTVPANLPGGLAVHTETEQTYRHTTPINAAPTRTSVDPSKDVNGAGSGAAASGLQKADSDSGASSATLNGSGNGANVKSATDEKDKLGLRMPINERRDSEIEGRDTLGTLPPSPTATKRSPLAAGSASPVNEKSRKVQRTASGNFPHSKRGRSNTATSQATLPDGAAGDNMPSKEGGESVSEYGMVPVSRMTSLPPGVGPFGGTAASGEDAELGLRAVRSWQEELERQEAREKEGLDPWAVRFEQGDPENPKNWGVGYRWMLTGIGGLLVLNSTFASSAPSGIVTPLREEFGFSQEVAILTIALFVAGYCVGPLLWGPLSESYGRRPIFLITFLVYTGFQVGCALSPNTASILIFRFLGGTFASAPLTNSGALLADIWDGDHRGQAMSVFALAPFAGPSIGPIVSGFIATAGVNWRWVFWILTMFAGFCFFVILFFVPETYAPALLMAKARKMRKETGEERWYAPLERSPTDFKTRVNTILFKPFIMLVQEPMLLAITLYMSFVYGVVYLLFEAFPFVFVRNHGFNEGENGLTFLGFFLGGAICVGIYILFVEPRYQRHAAKMAPRPPSPEKRLELCVFTAWALVIAMFWFGWTSYSSIHWVSPLLAAVLLGVGILGMFVTLFNYIIDVYLWSAASALSAATVCRSAFGAGFPLFATQMYEKLGPQWASSLLGFLALVMAPIPLVLMRYGPALRARSKYSPSR